MRSFVDKVAVITGAARGIGLALANALHARGCAVALVDIESSLPEVAAGFRDGPRVTAHVCDVRDRARVAAIVGEVQAVHGRVNILVNNAGVALAGRFLEVSAEDFDWVMAVNFGGALNMARAFVPAMLHEPEAQLLNVCSSFAWLGVAGKTGYGASKAALRAFSEALRAELSQTSVGVTLLFPGPVATELVQRGRAASQPQKTAEAEFVASRAIPVERVVRRALNGMRRNASRVVVGMDYRLIDALVRISPAFAHAVATRASRTLPF